MKDDKYSINEIIRFAIEIENEGILFYQKMSGKTKVKDLNNLYLQLKNDEQSHKNTFEGFLESLPKQEEYLYTLDNENIRYLHAIIENTIFEEDKINELVSLLVDDINVLEYAISKEQDSIDFYTNMKKLTAEDKAGIIDKIIKEEEDHLKMLTEFSEKLGSDK
jgi:rubrerythrin